MRFARAEQDQGTGEPLCAPTGQTPASRAVQQAIPQGAYGPVAVSGGGNFSITHWTVKFPLCQVNLSTRKISVKPNILYPDSYSFLHY